MTVTIPDEMLDKAGLDGRDFLIEVACRLYDAQKLTKPAARRFANLSQGEFEDELLKRGLAIYQIRDEVGFEDLRHYREGKSK